MQGPGVPPAGSWEQHPHAVKDGPTDGDLSQAMVVHPNRQLIGWAGTGYFPAEYCEIFHRNTGHLLTDHDNVSSCLHGGKVCKFFMASWRVIFEAFSRLAIV